MNDATHSPVPWVRAGRRIKASRVVGVLRNGREVLPIIQAVGLPGTWSDEDAENLDLICLAVNHHKLMLEALLAVTTEGGPSPADLALAQAALATVEAATPGGM